MFIATWVVVFSLTVPTQAEAFFFLAAIPAIAAAGSAAATAATVATAVAAVASAAATVLSSVAANKRAKNEAAQLELNSRLEGTRALQRDTQRRRQLERTIGTIRAARGSRGDSSPLALAFINEANEEISSDRQTELANSRQRQQDLLFEAADARRRGRASLISGVVKAGAGLAASFASSVG